MASKNKLKEIPKFKNETEEADFWDKHDSTEFLDWDKAEIVKPKTKPISIRLPEDLIEYIKEIAEEKDLPYQRLIRSWLREKLNEEKKQELKA